MTYYSKRQQWGYYITTTADNEKVTIDADAKEYNKTTRTDYADEKTLHFDANDGKLSQASASTGINIAKAGTYTIIVAADGKGYLTYSVVEGKVDFSATDEPQVKYPAELYMVKKDDVSALSLPDSPRQARRHIAVHIHLQPSGRNSRLSTARIL